MALNQDTAGRSAPLRRRAKNPQNLADLGRGKEKTLLDYGTINSARARFRRFADVALKNVEVGELHLLCHHIAMYAELPASHSCSREKLNAELIGERDLAQKMNRGLLLVRKGAKADHA